jgi:hypothetical protein
LKKIIIFCWLSLVLSAAAYGGQPSRIELADGSTINGEVIALAGGVYAIKTAVFGQINVPAEKVSKIESINYLSVAPAVPATPLASEADPAASQVSAYGQTLMKDPQNASLVSGLAKDPVLQEMAKDPELAAAAKNGDISALLKNPKFMDIVNSPEVQEAVKKLKK